jgi:hypothetical protein
MPVQHLPPPRVRANSNAIPSTKTVGINAARQQVRQFPQPQSSPVWLRSLLSLHRGVKIVFGGIFGLSLIGYGFTVYTQDTWKHQHGQLKRLQVQERQQSVMTENLKHQLAATAEEPNSKLVPPAPKQILFLPSAPARPARLLPSAPTAPTPQQPPVGY